MHVLSRERYFIHLIRIVSLFSRAGIVFLVAKTLTHDDVATFSLVVSTSALLVILLGFDFTRYVQREINNRAVVNAHGEYIGPLLAFVIFSNILFVLAFLAIKQFYDIDWLVGISLIAITFFEHLSQELSRLLVFYNKQLQSAIGLFLRTAMPVILIFIFALTGVSYDVYTIFMLMALFSFVSFSFLYRSITGITRIRWPENTNVFLWYRRGIVFSFFFFLSTVSVKALFAIDKAVLSIYYDNEMLANYAITLSAAMVVIPVIDIIIGSYSFPEIYSIKRDRSALAKVFRKNMRSTALLVFIFYACGAPFFSLVSDYWFEDYQYISYQFSYVVFLGPCIYVLAVIPSQILTVLEDFRAIVFSSILMLFVFLGLVIASLGHYYSVPLSMAAAFTLFSVYRMWRSSALMRADNGFSD